MTETRTYLERQLIGGAIAIPYNALAICDILRPANFSDELCQRLMKVIAHLVPKGEFTPVDISICYMREFSETEAWKITELMHGYIGGNTELMAISLLEIDLKTKFCAFLKGMETYHSKNQTFEIAGMYKNCLSHFEHPETDVLKAIPVIHQYLKQYVPDEMDEYETLMQGLPTRVDMIKSKAKTRSFLAILSSLGQGANTREQQACIETLSELITISLSGSKLSPAFVHHLELLKTHL